MTTKTKLTALLLITVSVWQVSLTGSKKMTTACGFFSSANPCKVSDNARQTLYLIAGGLGLGLALRKNKTES